MLEADVALVAHEWQVQLYVRTIHDLHRLSQVHRPLSRASWLVVQMCFLPCTDRQVWSLGIFDSICEDNALHPSIRRMQPAQQTFMPLMPQ